MNVIRKTGKRLFLLFLGIMSFSFLVAQTDQAVKGIVTDQHNEPVIGASVLVKGTSLGTITDIDGRFQVAAQKNDVLIVSYLGYKTQEVTVNGANITIQLAEDTELLEEVVVIGYGSVRKQDLSGSVVAIKPDEMNRGLSLAPQDLLAGKIAGVAVTNAGGQPGGSNKIRIRGGSSLSASNDPLIVIDGIILTGGSMDGLSNPLSMVNPSDIETFTVLKDASATAIYGSRASNGVIIITTKKGTEGKIKFAYNGTLSVSSPKKKYEVMSGDEYRGFINSYPDGVVSKGSMLSILNQYPEQSTDWQDEIFRTAVGTDHNLSMYGSLNNMLPYRVSLGYTNENGILDTSNFERYSGGISLTPSLFDDHLKVNLNAKGSIVNNQFADTGAIGAAIAFDPTKPVMDGNSTYGGYYTWTSDGTPDGPKVGSTTINPVSLLKMKDDHARANSFIGNAQFDYKLHFMPDIRLNLNLAMDYTDTSGQNYIQPNAPSNYGADPNSSGSNSYYDRTYKNELFEFYGQYAKDLKEIRSHLDVMAGYSYQRNRTNKTGESYYLSRNEENFGENTELQSTDKWSTQYVLISFYGRVNYSLMDKYLLTFTLRDDASSRFSKDNRWGLFPAAALAWRMNEEAFLKEADVLSNLKLRLGWGVTGQQNINRGDYPYMNFYKMGLGGAMFPSYDENGNVTWINVVSTTAANPNLKWEETTTWNIGLDYGFLNNRINGSLDAYFRKTKDLINNEVNVAAGTNFAETVSSNIGTLENKGIEFSINALPIQNRDMTWGVGFNIAYNKSEITELTYNDKNVNSPGKRFEGTGGDGGLNIKIHQVGQAPGSFYAYEQIYNEQGKPIEGAYVDRNGDGKIDDKDLYVCGKPDPDVVLGFNSKLTYKAWDFGFNGRANIGQSVYNAMAANGADLSTNGVFAHNTLSNRPMSALSTNFQARYRLSDYYVQKATFLKIDNITLGYTFGKCSLKPRIFATVQNPIVITKYDGLDPETDNGMDNNIYPRPLTCLFGINLNF